VQHSEAKDLHQRALSVGERKAAVRATSFRFGPEAASVTALAASSVKDHSVLAVGLLARLQALVQPLVLAADDDQHRTSLP
jgi:hypothetical protein